MYFRDIFFYSYVAYWKHNHIISNIYQIVRRHIFLCRKKRENEKKFDRYSNVALGLDYWYNGWEVEEQGSNCTSKGIGMG